MFGGLEKGIGKAFGKRAPESKPPVQESVELASNEKINTPEGLIALAEKWSEKTELADNLRKLAQLLSIRETDAWVTDDAKRVDELFAVINSQGRLIGINLRPGDF